MLKRFYVIKRLKVGKKTVGYEGVLNRNWSVTVLKNTLIRHRHFHQWRIQEFQNGRARSRRGRIFRSGVCFDAPSHIPYLFVARVVNKINNVNIVY